MKYPPSLAAVLVRDQVAGFSLDTRCPEVGQSELHVFSPIVVSRLFDMSLRHDRFPFSPVWVEKEVWPSVVIGGLQRVRSRHLTATNDLITCRFVCSIGSALPEVPGLPFIRWMENARRAKKYLVQFGRRSRPRQSVDSKIDPQSGMLGRNPIMSHESWQLSVRTPRGSGYHGVPLK